MTDVPAKRIIETASYNEDPDVTEEEADEIKEAIYRGRLMWYVASSEKGYSRGRNREVDLTAFRDPHSNTTRYAVETWLGSRKWTEDFAAKDAAWEHTDRQRRMVSL